MGPPALNVMDPKAQALAHVNVQDDVLFLKGAWTLRTLQRVERQHRTALHEGEGIVCIDGSGITEFDTAGACMLKRLMACHTNAGVDLQHFKAQHLSLLESLNGELPNVQSFNQPSWLHRIGSQAALKQENFKEFLAFIGRLVLTCLTVLRAPWRLAWRDLFAVIEHTGVGALALIALLAFLVGIVFSYQMGLYLQRYGAEIYIVPMSGLVILREFGPLITAIILAGRTGSSFAALIGVMKINEEIDALRVMGISPVERLVLPRVLACLVVMPLLSFWADVFGIMGSMMVAQTMLSVNAYDYLAYLREYIDWSTYVLGLMKAPVFALIIVLVGCFQGFQTKLQANSIGRQTTHSVVQSMFFIIVADAILSISFKWQGVA